MKKVKQKSLISQIDDQIATWRPTASYVKSNPKYAKAMNKDADIVAAKLYTTHGIVGEKETYKIFGYGSLLNERSRSRTMTPRSVAYDRVAGYRRIYNLEINNGTCLNVEPSQTAVIDGAVCEIDRDDMMQFILREFQYEVLPITTQKGEEVFMVMATKEAGHKVVGPEDMIDPKSKYEWNDVMPRLDYINACYHGICELADANKTEHLFLTADNVLFDNEPLSELIEELSPTILEIQDDGSEISVNRLLRYWETIDSAY